MLYVDWELKGQKKLLGRETNYFLGLMHWEEGGGGGKSGGGGG